MKPVIDKPAGSPPPKLVKEDIVKGKGPAAKKGDSVTMQYVGVSFSNGRAVRRLLGHGRALRPSSSAPVR